MNGMPAPQAPYTPRKTSTLAVISFVLACLVIVPLVPLIGSILGIVAIVRLAGRPHLGGKGLAIAAIPVGLVVVFFFQGILAAIAIPAFIKYIRKSKTVEATEALDRLSVGARSYAMADRYGNSGSLLPRAFPAASTGWVPEAPCCNQPSAPKCTPQLAAWQQPPWKELHFQLSEPHYFQYRYEGSGSSFTVEARGDLDCDGDYSSFRVSGTLAPDGTVQLSGLRVENELE